MSLRKMFKIFRMQLLDINLEYVEKQGADLITIIIFNEKNETLN